MYDTACVPMLKGIVAIPSRDTKATGAYCPLTLPGTAGLKQAVAGPTDHEGGLQECRAAVSS